MIHKLKAFLLNLSIYSKVVIGILLFTFIVGGVERYQISNNIINQFFEAKKARNHLLINTITPILGLNISLGLEDANKEYLSYILKQNSDIVFIELKNNNNQILFKNGKDNTHIYKDNAKQKCIDFCNSQIVDTTSKEILGSVHIHFSNKDFYILESQNKLLTLKLFIITIVLLALFVFMLRREFYPLERLSRNVLSYDPKLNNFSLNVSPRNDEVGIIQNAIVSMVERISSYTQLLDKTNLSLEDKIKERTKELEEANALLKKLTITDELTQLANRRYFEEHFKKTWEFAKRQDACLALIICDIDHFKMVNDTYGHHIGDEVLKKVALSLKDSLKRSSDFVARYGGEEFIIVMYEANNEQATLLCKSIQKNLQIIQQCSNKEEKIEPVTISFGISYVNPNKNNDAELLLKNADDALYRAKESGRNRIVCYESTELTA